MSMEIHVIKTLQPGVFYTLLDFPSPSIVLELLSDSYRWVLRWEYSVGNHQWKEFNLPVRNVNDNVDVFTRSVEYDLLVETQNFRKIYSDNQTMKMVQLKEFPPNHLDMRTLKGEQKYRLLDELGWNFVCNIPGARDYAEIESPSRELIEKAIEINKAER